MKWSSSTTGVPYVLVPGAGKDVKGKACRQYSYSPRRRGERRRKRQGTACQTASGSGAWLTNAPDQRWADSHRHPAENCGLNHVALSHVVMS